MVEQPIYNRPVAGSMPALERKDASAVETESGLIPACFGITGASDVPQGQTRSVGFARWDCSLCCPQGRQKMNAERPNCKLESPPV
jgi:hypothetical protein